MQQQVNMHTTTSVSVSLPPSPHTHTYTHTHMFTTQVYLFIYVLTVEVDSAWAIVAVASSPFFDSTLPSPYEGTKYPHRVCIRMLLLQSRVDHTMYTCVWKSHNITICPFVLQNQPQYKQYVHLSFSVNEAYERRLI